jgi:flagellin
MNSAIDVTKEIKNKLVAARQPGIDREKVQSEITELQNQLKSVRRILGVLGENWLSVDSSDAAYNATKTMIASFSRSGGSVSVGTLSIDVDGVKLLTPMTSPAFSIPRTRRRMAAPTIRYPRSTSPP